MSKAFWQQFFELVYENCGGSEKEALMGLQKEMQSIVEEFAYGSEKGQTSSDEPSEPPEKKVKLLEKASNSRLGKQNQGNPSHPADSSTYQRSRHPSAHCSQYVNVPDEQESVTRAPAKRRVRRLYSPDEEASWAQFNISDDSQ